MGVVLDKNSFILCKACYVFILYFRILNYNKAKAHRAYAEVRDEKVCFFAMWNLSVFVAGA